MAGDNLKLSVLLAAVDKATGPFRRIMAGSKGVAAAIVKSQTALRQLNEQQRGMDSFRRLETQASQTSQQLQAQRRVLAELTAQYNQLDAPTKKQTRELKQQAAEVGRLVAIEQRQNTQLAGQRQALAAAGIETSRFAVHQRRLTGDIDQANRKLKDQHAQLARLKRANEQAQKIHRAGMTASLHGAGMLFAGQRALRAEMLPLATAMDFESAMADVRKVVDFDTPEQFAAMGRDVQDLSRRLPMLPTEIAKIVAAAGQASIARNELLLFTEDAVKMGVAFDTTAEDAGQTMATWRTAFRMGQRDVVQLADRINYLGNTGPASVQKISDVVNRIGALGEVAGMQSGPLAAMAATVAGMGIESEVSATGIKNMLLTLASGSAATKRQRAAMKAIGVDAVDMSRRMQDDAGGAIMFVLEKLRQLPKFQQAATMTTLFGRESIGAIAPLLTNLELLATNFDKVTDAQKYAGSMEAEYASRVSTSANTLQLLKNTTMVLAQSIGATLIPDFKVFAERTGAVVGRIVEWIRANPELVRGIARVVVGGTALATLLGGLLMTGGFAAMAFSQIHRAVAILSGGKGFGALLQSGGQLAGRVMPWIFNGARMLLPILGGISAPVLAIGAAVAVVAALVWRYWQPIKAFMLGVWQGLTEAAGPVLEEIRAALAPLAPVWNLITDAAGKLWGVLRELFTPFQATNEQLASATGHGRSFGRVLGAVLTLQVRLAVKALGWLVTGFLTVHRVVSRVLGGIASYVRGFGALLSGVFSGDLGKIRAGVQAMWSGVNAVMAGWPARLQAAGGRLVRSMALGVAQRAGVVLSAARALWGQLQAYLGGAWSALAGLFTADPGRVRAGLQAMWTAANTVLAGWPAQLLQVGVQLVAAIGRGIAQRTDGVLLSLASLWLRMRAMVRGAWLAVTGVFAGDGGRVRAGLQAMWTSINSVLAGWPAKMMQAGVNLVTGLITGIKSMLGKATDAVASVGTGVIARFKSLLGIRSPSRVFAQLGGFTMQGFANGLLRAQGGPLSAMQGMGERLQRIGAGVAMSAAVASPAFAFDNRAPVSVAPRPAPAAAGDTYHIQIHVGSNADTRAIEAAVREALERVQREKHARDRSRLTDD
jgi:TP901 family phage tail tape measure protein